MKPRLLIYTTKDFRLVLATERAVLGATKAESKGPGKEVSFQNLSKDNTVNCSGLFTCTVVLDLVEKSKTQQSFGSRRTSQNLVPKLSYSLSLTLLEPKVRSFWALRKDCGEQLCVQLVTQPGAKRAWQGAIMLTLLEGSLAP